MADRVAIIIMNLFIIQVDSAHYFNEQADFMD